jgi:hypothetical protein
MALKEDRYNAGYNPEIKTPATMIPIRIKV